MKKWKFATERINLVGHASHRVSECPRIEEIIGLALGIVNFH